ncbi:MAG: hypothetical protein E7514_02765 [Ruminococcaceae bacterium]|nr:hypothetical protein [Oscillospiraceae bacterium]
MKSKTKNYTKKGQFIKASVLSVIIPAILSFSLSTIFAYIPVFVTSPFFSGKAFALISEFITTFGALGISYFLTKYWYSNAFERLGKTDFLKCFLMFFAIFKAMAEILNVLFENLGYVILEWNITSGEKTTVDVVNSKFITATIISKSVTLAATVVMLVLIFYTVYEVIDKAPAKSFKAFSVIFPISFAAAFILSLVWGIHIGNAASSLVYTLATVLLSGVYLSMFTVRVKGHGNADAKDELKTNPLIFIAAVLIVFPAASIIYKLLAV